MPCPPTPSRIRMRATASTTPGARLSAAAGTAGLGIVLEPVRPLLMAASGALILFGVWQLYRRGASCAHRSRASVVVFWICAAVVALMAIAPQIVASFLADL